MGTGQLAQRTAGHSLENSSNEGMSWCRELCPEGSEPKGEVTGSADIPQIRYLRIRCEKTNGPVKI